MVNFLDNIYDNENDEYNAIYCKVDESKLVDYRNLTEEQLSNIDIVIYICIVKSSEIFTKTDNKIRKSRDIIIKIAKHNPTILTYLDDEFKNDEEIVSICLENSWDIFNYASQRLKNDDIFIRNQLIKKHNYNSNMIKYATNNIKKNKELVLLAIKKNFWSYGHIHEDLKNDREFIKSALELNGCVIYLVKNEFKNDDELVFIAVHSTPHAIKFTLEKYKNNKPLAKIALYEKTEEIKTNKKKILNSNTTSDEITYDKTINCNIFNEHHDFEHLNVYSQGYYIQYLSDNLKNDFEIIECGLKNSCWTFCYLDENKRNDYKFILWALQINASIYQFINDEYKKNAEIIEYMTITNNFHDMYNYFPNEIKNKKSVIKNMVSNNYRMLRDVNPCILDDDVFMLEIMNDTNFRVFEFASKRIKTNKELVIKAINIEPLCMQYIETTLNKECVHVHFKNDLIEDVDIAIILINLNINSIKYLSNGLKNNKDIKKYIEYVKKYTKYINDFKNDENVKTCLEHINENNTDKKYTFECFLEISQWVFYYLDETTKNDEQFILNAIKINENVYNILDEKYKGEEYLTQYLNMNYKCIKYVDDSLLDNVDYILEKIETLNYNVFKYASDRIKMDKDFIINAININYNCLQYVDFEILTSNVHMANTLTKVEYNKYKFMEEKKIIFKIMKEIDYNVFKYASHNIKTDKESVIDAVIINPLCFKYISCKLNNNNTLISFDNELIYDCNLAKIILDKNPELIIYFSSEVQENNEITTLLKSK